MSYKPPLPPGLSPILAGRYGLWLLSRRSHRAALRRTAFVSRVRNRSLADRYWGLVCPWRVYEYPGGAQFIAALFGISRHYARDLCTGGKRLPVQHARRLMTDLEGRIASMEALRVELREYVRRIECDRAMHPHRGYENGLRRWRREQAAMKAAVSSRDRE